MDPAKYAELFLAESREHLSTLNQQLVAWERDHAARAPIDAMFRAVHTVKGMAATMGYATVANIAHHLENLLDIVRRDDVSAGPEVADVLFQAADHLEQAIAVETSGGDASAGAVEVLAALEDIAGGLAPSAGTKRTSRASVPAVPALAGAGRLVRVTVRPDASLRGARALLVLSRIEALGAVSGVAPPRAEFESDAFDGRFSFRLESDAEDEAIVACVRAAGEIADVEVPKEQAASAKPAAAQPARHIRVDLRRFDRLMSLIGELVTARGRLAEISAERQDPDLEDVTLRMTHLAGALQSEIIDVRMTPVWHVFDRFPRLVRDVSRNLGKEVAFEVEGKEIELDRAILDDIAEPLVHMLRNAIDHGIESPADRKKAGKAPRGNITLSAFRDRSAVVIEVRDDGRGIDPAFVLERAREAGLVGADVDSLSPDMLVKVLAQPGFSTATEVSEVSGRGVGIDVVATHIRALGGSLDIRSDPGRGSTFTLRLPPTLAILPALVARVGEERYALPLTHVQETVEFEATERTEMDGAEAILLRDQVVPIVRLRSIVEMEGAPPGDEPVIILEIGDRRSGLVVDRLLGQRDIVVKSFDPPAGALPIFTGATVMGDGLPVLILDAPRLV